MRQPVRVWEDVYLIGSAELSHPYDCCVYLINAGELVLIDAGAGQSFGHLVDNIVALGFAPEKRFSLHLTLARVKSQKGKEQLKDFLFKNRERSFGNFIIDSVRLKKSVLTPKGPIYSTLGQTKLTGW